MAKKEKVVDLKQRVDKISEQHLTELQSIVNTLNATQFNIGKIEVQKHKLLHELATVQDNITMLQDKMTKEYGTFDINIDDGTINWPKENKDEK
jgi:hypothetical protein|tara:strand:+ start:1811 stop:2092 length:282 start_codon:yes stop_codon:yes gene_type:complete